MPKIVVLDAFTTSPLQPGEVSPDHPAWERISRLGDLTLHDRTPAGDVVARAAGAEVILTNKTPLRAEVINALPQLRYIGVMATGTNVVELGVAKQRGVVVTNVPGYSTPSVVQVVFGLLLELSTKVGETALAVRSGAWARCPDFSFTVAPFRELCGKTFGVVGFGAIGSGVARVASALGMEVIVHSRSRKTDEEQIEWVSLEELLRRSDVISLHSPLVPETERLIRRETLALMKPGALLINTGRGPLLDEDEVAEALVQGRLGGLGADVLRAEPPGADHPLVLAPNTVITPHLGWASVEARHRLMERLADNIGAFLAGSPINVVNG